MGRFERLGGFAFRRRRWIIGFWVLGLFALGPSLQALNDRFSQGGFEVPGSQSDQVKHALETDFAGQYDLTDLLVMRSRDRVATDPAFRAAFAAVAGAVRAAPGIAAVSDPYASPARAISADGHVLTAVVGITGDQDLALANNPAVEKAVEDASRGTGIEAYVTGSPPFYAAFEETTLHDLERAERIALPIALVILVVAFGSIVAAGIPLFMALIGLGAAFGIISIIATQTLVSSFAQNIASMIGIGVGIDYSLFVVTRFREHLRAGDSTERAISTAMETSGKAVFVSALTVVVALSGTQLVNIAAFRSMGFAAMICVALAGAAALTLLPALLSVLGPRIDKLRVGHAREAGGWWHRWALAVMRRPWRALIASLAIITVLAVPALGMRMGSSGPRILPPDAKPRIAAEIAADAFGEGQVAPAQIVYDDPRGVLGEGFDDVYRFAYFLLQDPEVVRVDSIASLAGPPDLGANLDLVPPFARAAANAPEARPFVSPLVARNGTRTLINVVTKHGAQSDEASAFIDRTRAQIAQQGGDIHPIVGGDPGLNEDINDELRGALLPVVGLVLVMSFLLLMVFFRSILLPLKAILMNTASVAATYGVLVFVFQDGHFEGLLGFESAGNIDSVLPLFLFCILFGLSMDYEVFMLARIREEYLRTGDNTEAVGWGLEHTARIITSAALIMVTVFGAFTFARLIPIKAMGLGLAVAVALDATLIRTVMVPATMRLMGDANWWLPKWLDRILPQISVEGTPARPATAPPAGTS